MVGATSTSLAPANAIDRLLTGPVYCQRHARTGVMVLRASRYSTQVSLTSLSHPQHHRRCQEECLQTGPKNNAMRKLVVSAVFDEGLIVHRCTQCRNIKVRADAHQKDVDARSDARATRTRASRVDAAVGCSNSNSPKCTLTHVIGRLRLRCDYSRQRRGRKTNAE